jgi:cell division protein FtsW
MGLPKKAHLGLIVAVLGMVLFGLAMLYSASSYNSMIYYGTEFYYVTSQAIGFILGIALMIFMYFFDYKILKKFSVIIYIVGLCLLVLVFVPAIGITKLGASRWIGIGGFSMQPSELAKFAFVILASVIASKTDRLGLKRFIIILGAGLCYCGLIFLEPNLSITLVLAGTVFMVLFLYGAKLRHILFVVAPAIVALPVMLIAEPYRVRRLLAFVDPWANPKDEGFQLIQSLFGLGNGGFFGVGFGQSTQKHMFLPFAESDFIFSIIGEEFGFLGSVLFTALLFSIIVMVFRVGMRCPDRFGKFLCFGIATVLFIQSAVNLAVVTGTIPPTGVPLPFISFGGTSLAVYMAVIGIVLNIEKSNRSRKDAG